MQLRLNAHRPGQCGGFLVRAVADQDHALQAEALAQLVDSGTERAGIGGVAGEGLHGDRAALGVAQQAVGNPGPVGAMVARIAALGERAAGALDSAVPFKAWNVLPHCWQL